jgi:predicted transposase/invertase (TIGR01784 family)
LLAFDWFEDARYYHGFHLRDDENGAILTDLLELHLLEIEKIKKIGRTPKNALEAWLMYFSNLEGDEMEGIAMENPAIQKAMTIEEIFWKSEKERRLYELREKAIREEFSALVEARAEGEAKGKVKGKVEGKVEGKVDTICKLLNKRFKGASSHLQAKVSEIKNLEILDLIFEDLIDAAVLSDAQDIIGRYLSN